MRGWIKQIRGGACTLMPLMIIAAATLAVQPPAPRAARDSSARQRVREAKTYCCYYGPNRADELSCYDFVILHTPAATGDLVKQLKAAGVVTIGYITCGEDTELQKGDGKGPAGMASWYMDKNNDGQPDTHSTWKSYYTDAGNEGWRRNRVAEAKRLVEEIGFDGIFLDTVDDVTVFPETFDGMVQLIRDFRQSLPHAPIIMNQSWELMRRVAPEIDGVMLEGFSTSYDFENKRHRRNPKSWDDDGLAFVKKYIEPLRREHSMQVIVLDYAGPQDTELMQAAADRAATFGFLHCIAPMTLDEIYPTKVTGRVDRKWLEPQALKKH